MSRKGQIWSLDFAMSVMIFSLLIVMLFFSWSYLYNQNLRQLEFADIENMGLVVSDSLIRGQGVPADWNATNVQTIGLAETDNVLDTGKVVTFFSMNYLDARPLIGVSRYNYYIEMSDINGTLITYGGMNLTQGFYPSGAVMVVPVERFVIYNSSLAKFRFILWS